MLAPAAAWMSKRAGMEDGRVAGQRPKSSLTYSQPYCPDFSIFTATRSKQVSTSTGSTARGTVSVVRSRGHEAERSDVSASVDDDRLPGHALQVQSKRCERGGDVLLLAGRHCVYPHPVRTELDRERVK